MNPTREQLTRELARVAWSEIVPHARRDAVIVVEQTLDLIDVGEAIAADNTILVQQWISQSLIHKPSLEDLSNWNLQPERVFFTTLIVQPFVLVSRS